LVTSRTWGEYVQVSTSTIIKALPLGHCGGEEEQKCWQEIEGVRALEGGASNFQGMPVCRGEEAVARNVERERTDPGRLLSRGA